MAVETGRKRAVRSRLRWAGAAVLATIGTALAADVASALPSPPTRFVMRDGSALKYRNVSDGLPGAVFPFVGANLALGAPYGDLNGNGIPTPASNADGAFTAAEMGATVIRTKVLGTQYGCAGCVAQYVPSGTDGAYGSLSFDDSQFAAIDEAIATAAAAGLRVLIVLTNDASSPGLINAPYTQSGAGEPGTREWFTVKTHEPGLSFYTPGSRANLLFKSWISHLLNHAPAGGVALKDNPAILGWDIGNELVNNGAAAPFWSSNEITWTADISAYIKSTEGGSGDTTPHLIADGHVSKEFTDQPLYDAEIAAATAPNVDLYSGHYYGPRSVARLTSDANQVKGLGKAFFVGEYEWNEPGAEVSTDVQPLLGPPGSGFVESTGTTPNQTSLGLAQANLSMTGASAVSVTLVAKGVGFTNNAGSPVPAKLAASIRETGGTQNVPLSCRPTGQPAYSGPGAPPATPLTSSWVGYTCSTASAWRTGPATNNVLSFDVGGVQAVWLDSMSVTNGSASVALTNPAFSDPTLSPWYLVQRGAVGDSLAAYLTAIENSTYGIDGDLLWELQPHVKYSGFWDGGQNGLHYPGDTATERASVAAMRTHAYVGRTNPGHYLSTAPPFISFPGAALPGTPASPAGAIRLQWGGIAGATKYKIERAEYNTGTASWGGWNLLTTEAGEHGYPADQPVFVDSTPPTGKAVRWRVTPIGFSGVLGTVSANYANTADYGTTD